MPVLGSGAASALKYQPGIQLYNATETSMRRFRRAMGIGLGGGTNAHIMCYGDSITQGTGASTFGRGFPAQLASILSTRLGVTMGTGYIAALNWSTDSRFAITGTLTHDTSDSGSGGNGPGPVGTNQSLASGGTIVFTPGRSDIDQFIVYYYGGGGYSQSNTLSAQVDSGTAQTASCYNGGSGSASSMTLAATPGTAHTLTITASGGSIGVLGIEGRVNGGVGGLRVGRAGYSAKKMQHLSNNTYTSSSLQTSTNFLHPHLYVVMMQTNDYGAQTDLATYTSLWQQFITQAFSAGNNQGDVLIVTTVPPNTAQPGPLALSDYTNALYQLADTNNCAVLDISARWKDASATGSFDLYSDPQHPNDGGHRDIAQALANAIISCGGA